jgi:exosortase F-associated protein
MYGFKDLSVIATDNRSKRLLLILFSLAGLAFVFLFQNLDLLYLACGCELHPNTHFAVKKFIRVLWNDAFMIGLIHAWFYDRQVTRLAFYVQLVDTFVLLPVYLFIKLALEGDSEISSPLLSQFHRLIVNPTLMLLIIPAVYYQRLTGSKQG